jgi:acetyl-CoA carboxylase biotin carboxyl carrier protein
MPSKKKTSKPVAVNLPGLDMAEVERLLAFMDKHGLAEFEYAQGDRRIALKRGGGNSAGAPVAAQPAPAGRPAATQGKAAPAETPSAAPSAPADENHIIKSPIVGTYFSAAGPDAPPYVKVGDHVKTGQVLCIIEAMKLMNEIESDVNGVVARLLVENGLPVEYGQPLFAIRPDGKK